MPDKRRVTLWRSDDGKSRVLHRPASDVLTFTTDGDFVVHISLAAPIVPTVESASEGTTA